MLTIEAYKESEELYLNLIAILGSYENSPAPPKNGFRR